MGDARRQACERRHFKLLRLLFEYRGVFQKHQDAGGLGRADKNKPRQQGITGAGSNELESTLRHGFVQPLKKLGGKAGGDIREQRPLAGTGIHAEKIARGFVQHVHVAYLVAHQHTGLHALDNEVVDLRHIGQVHTAALGQILRGAQTLRQGIGKQSGGEGGNAQQARLGVAFCGPVAAGECAPVVFQ